MNREGQHGFAVSSSSYEVAKAFLDHLLPYCRYHFGDNALAWFTIAEQSLRQNDVSDPAIQGVKQTIRDCDKDMFTMEAGWELLDGDSDEEVEVTALQRVENVPQGQQSAGDRALGGRGANDSLLSFSEAQVRGAPGRVSREDLPGGATRQKKTGSDRSCGESSESESG